MFNTELVRKAVLDAMKIREDSFVEESGEYDKDYIMSMIESCKNNNLDLKMAYILYLAVSSWWNDAADWANGECDKCGGCGQFWYTGNHDDCFTEEEGEIT